MYSVFHEVKYWVTLIHYEVPVYTYHWRVLLRYCRISLSLIHLQMASAVHKSVPPHNHVLLSQKRAVFITMASGSAQWL